MRKILKGLTFIGIFIVLLIITSHIFSPKNNDKESGMLQPTAYGILTEEKNTIDTLIIGDSESYSSFSPMQLWDEYGYTSYVCGTPAQQLYQSYDFLQQALKTQKPKIVILETNAIYRKIHMDKYLYYLCEQNVPVLKYHDRWKKIKPSDFHQPISYTWQHDMKGYRYQTGIKSPKPHDYMKNKKTKKTISQKSLYFLEKIRKLCEKEGIQFILVSSPSLKNWSYEKHMGVQDYAQKHGIEFVDMNLRNKELKINWLKDTRDLGDHLNFQGARKVTRYLGDYLHKKKTLTNHKNDKKYEKWDIYSQKYRAKVQKNG